MLKMPPLKLTPIDEHTIHIILNDMFILLSQRDGL